MKAFLSRSHKSACSERYISLMSLSSAKDKASSPLKEIEQVKMPELSESTLICTFIVLDEVSCVFIVRPPLIFLLSQRGEHQAIFYLAVKYYYQLL